jgi:hypothetical protein
MVATLKISPGYCVWSRTGVLFKHLVKSVLKKRARRQPVAACAATGGSADRGVLRVGVATHHLTGAGKM